MDMENINIEQYIDFDSIKDRIKEFKSKKLLEESIYLEILNDLDTCYNYKAKKFIQRWSHKEDVLKTKEEFRKYLIYNIFNIANEYNKKKNYDNSLRKLKQLEKLIIPSDFELINKMDYLKSHCEFEI